MTLADGAVAWELPSTPERQFVSDPLRADGDTLVVCTARAVEGSDQLSLVTLDAITGRVVAEAPLVTLGSGWWTIRDCQLVAADGGWIVVAGGSVIACDDSGRIRWVRRDAWVPPAVDGVRTDQPGAGGPGGRRDPPPAVDAFWMLVSQGSTLVRDGRVHVVQPGVPGLVTLDAESGRVCWRLADPAVSRIRGLAAGRIIVERIGSLVAAAAVPAGETGDLLALDAATGERVWRFGPADLLDAGLVADDGLLVAIREPVAGKNARVATLVRLDPATGQVVHRWPLAACEDPQPFLGPLVPTAAGLHVFFGRGAGDATRDLLRLE